MKVVLALVLIVAPLAYADEATKIAKVESLLSLMNVEHQQKQIMDQMTQMVMSQFKEQMAKEPHTSAAEMAKAEDRQKKLIALIADQTSWIKMKPVFVKAYADTFTESEIDAISAFYRTPAGQAMIEKLPVIVGKVMQAAQAQMADLMPQIEAIIRER